MSTNPYVLLRALLPAAPLQVGTVLSVTTADPATGQLALVALPGGGTLQARGAAVVGRRVFVRDGVIEGGAPDLTPVPIEI